MEESDEDDFLNKGFIAENCNIKNVTSQGSINITDQNQQQEPINALSDDEESEEENYPEEFCSGSEYDPNEDLSASENESEYSSDDCIAESSEDEYESSNAELTLEENVRQVSYSLLPLPGILIFAIDCYLFFFFINVCIYLWITF